VTDEQQTQQQDDPTLLNGKKRITYLVGRLGADPKLINGKFGDFATFSVAHDVTFGSKDNPGETFWADANVSDPKMIERVMTELHKGDLVCVAGPLTDRDVEGRKFYKVSAWRISHVEWFERTPYQERDTVSAAEVWQPPF
jgi:single-stranded DNA-binding protein